MESFVLSGKVVAIGLSNVELMDLIHVQSIASVPIRWDVVKVRVRVLIKGRVRNRFRVRVRVKVRVRVRVEEKVIVKVRVRVWYLVRVI